MVRETTDKPISLKALEVLPHELVSYTTHDLNELRKSVLRDSPNPALYIVYVPRYKDEPEYAGITLHRDTLFIFKETLRSLNDYTDVQNRIEQSTLEHEWGHLLGLDHIDLPTCLMSESVEVYTNRVNQISNIPVEHCWNTLYELDQLKKQIN
jgi:predicted Zn-dependent protease